MAPESDRRIVDFLSATLALWAVEGTVEAAAAPAVAIIRVGRQAGCIALERAAAGDPFRWYVRHVAVGDPVDRTGSGPGRPCGSLVGVLGALRRLLSIETGTDARIARREP